MSLKRYTSLITFLFLISFHQITLQATQHALVVGIDQYPPGTASLEGAVNDAHLIERALRKIQVQLPEARVLLNSQATRAKIIDAWQQMVNDAKPGDTLIFTYAGHGSQQEDEPPLDEVDGKDETLVLSEGVLRDDELTELFAQASSYSIVFVADSCHSGGIEVRRKSFPSREICRFTAERSSSEPPTPPLNLTVQGDEKEVLKHVTVITAQQSDSQKVCEINAENQAHGALSYFFAQALGGFADGNNNSKLERQELEDYLSEKVVISTNRLQTPQLQPQTENRSVITLQGNPVTPAPAPAVNSEISEVAIRVEGGQPPAGLKNVRFVHDQSFELHFVMQGKQTEVLNQTGDWVVTQLSSQERSQWQHVINKMRLLKVLETQFDMRLRPVKIELREGAGLHPQGSLLHFTIFPSDPQLKALTLFNLTGNGELQFLYPLNQKQHPSSVAKFPYELKSLRVRSPFGGDNLVAILCDKPPTELQQWLENSKFLDRPLEVVGLLRQQRCQVGQHPFFTKPDN